MANKDAQGAGAYSRGPTVGREGATVARGVPVGVQKGAVGASRWSNGDPQRADKVSSSILQVSMGRCAVPVGPVAGYCVLSMGAEWQGRGADNGPMGIHTEPKGSTRGQLTCMRGSNGGGGGHEMEVVHSGQGVHNRTKLSAQSSCIPSSPGPVH